IDPTLAGYVKEEVMIRYDPADMAVIRVFHQERFVCRAICQELSGQTVSLKEIEKARSLRRKQVRAELGTRAALVDRFVEIHHEPTPEPKTRVSEPAPGDSRPQLEAGTSMTNHYEQPSQDFVVTKGYRRTASMCDACRRARVIGLGYGPAFHGKNRVRELLCPMEPDRAFFTRTLDHLHWTQHGGWPLSLPTLGLRFCSIGRLHPAVSNGLLYASGNRCSWAYRKRGADLVCSIFL